MNANLYLTFESSKQNKMQPKRFLAKMMRTEGTPTPIYSSIWINNHYIHNWYSVGTLAGSSKHQLLWAIYMYVRLSVHSLSFALMSRYPVVTTSYVIKHALSDNTCPIRSHLVTPFLLN